MFQSYCERIKPLFQAKLASNGAHVTVKAIVRPSDNSSSEEIQFRDLHL